MCITLSNVIIVYGFLSIILEKLIKYILPSKRYSILLLNKYFAKKNARVNPTIFTIDTKNKAYQKSFKIYPNIA